MIRVTRRLIRFLGWLLTPLVAWAAAFLGAWFGAKVAEGVASPKTGLMIMVAGAGLFGILSMWLWAKAIRRSARLRAWGRSGRKRRKKPAAGGSTGKPNTTDDQPKQAAVHD